MAQNKTVAASRGTAAATEDAPARTPPAPRAVCADGIAVRAPRIWEPCPCGTLVLAQSTRTLPVQPLRSRCPSAGSFGERRPHALRLPARFPDRRWPPVGRVGAPSVTRRLSREPADYASGSSAHVLLLVSDRFKKFKCHPGIHGRDPWFSTLDWFGCAEEWIPGTSPGMTPEICDGPWRHPYRFGLKSNDACT